MLRRPAALLTILATFLATGLAVADLDSGRVVLARENVSAAPEIGRVQIDLDPRGYDELRRRGQARIERFPLPGGQQVDLDVEPFQLLTHDAVIVEVDEEGERTVPPPDIRFVRGTVAGDVDSRVVLALYENRISGSIRTRDAAYGIGPRGRSLTSADALIVDVWNRELEEGTSSCSVSGEDTAEALSAMASFYEPDQGGDPARPSAIDDAQLLIELALDSTTEWCDHFGGNATDAQNYMLSTVAQISAIYDAELSLLVQVPYLRTFCGTSDPYTDGLGLNDRTQFLNEVESEWSTNQGAVSRTVAHAFSVSDFSNSAGGLAGTVSCSGPNCSPVLCDTSNGYAVNLLPAAGASPAAFEVSVAAHELGHNHSSPHTNCLQDGNGDWLSTCMVDTCPINPACVATGCFPGPADTNMTGTMMSTGCDSEIQEIDDIVVEPLMRGAAEDASCVSAAGLPGDSLGLLLSKPVTCPATSLSDDDNSLDSGLGGPPVWVKRFTPACTPLQLETVEAIVPDFGATAGDPLRILVYNDPSGSGDPANATLVYQEDVTVQLVSFFSFNQWTLANPVTLEEGDVYIGFLDPNGNVNSLTPLDSGSSGDSYVGGSTDPATFSLVSGFTFMVRGGVAPVPAGSFRLAWDLPCNDATTPGQDFAIYRGDLDNPGVYATLACTTDFERDFLAVGQPDDTYYLIVPNTSPSEGSYGLTSAGIQRPASATPCKPQNLEACP